MCHILGVCLTFLYVVEVYVYYIKRSHVRVAAPAPILLFVDNFVFIATIAIVSVQVEDQ